MYKYLFLLFPLILFLACVQILDEQVKVYKGDNGCLDCHSNSGRLKVLAPEAEESDGGGG